MSSYPYAGLNLHNNTAFNRGVSPKPYSVQPAHIGGEVSGSRHHSRESFHRSLERSHRRPRVDLGSSHRRSNRGRHLVKRSKSRRSRSRRSRHTKSRAGRKDIKKSRKSPRRAAKGQGRGRPVKGRKAGGSLK
ncbi:hypothetical protein RvY_19096-1 [Ramazzottius varieornatus]|uniref:Uncharacterized protein n=1 Tax=Ramazzottius varieornatus TaxID=947166 RepID=A0A1D1WAJ1_RAMVA|nr:hypothetical protein RvY_19096-1 [Ramazzottius varieornatus]